MALDHNILENIGYFCIGSVVIYSIIYKIAETCEDIFSRELLTKESIEEAVKIEYKKLGISRPVRVEVPDSGVGFLRLMHSDGSTENRYLASIRIDGSEDVLTIYDLSSINTGVIRHEAYHTAAGHTEEPIPDKLLRRVCYGLKREFVYELLARIYGGFRMPLFLPKS